MTDYPNRGYFYQQSGAGDQIPSSVPRPEMPKRRFKFDRKRAPIYLVGTVAAVLVILVGLGAGGIGPLKFSKGKVLGAKTGDYQAVFLANGQVYFGHLKGADEQYLTLSNIFYLKEKNNTDIQASKDKEATAKTADDFELVKLGSELHGPQDEMKINRDQVLFYENLKSDGKVAQAIANYQQTK
jgi:hypothetical protein